MRLFLVLFFSLCTFTCFASDFASDKEIKLVDIIGVVLVVDDKEYRVASDNRFLRVNDKVLVTKYSTVKILYIGECQIDIPENSMVDIYDTCEETENSIVILNEIKDYTLIDKIFYIMSILYVFAAIITIIILVIKILSVGNNSDDEDTNSSIYF